MPVVFKESYGPICFGTIEATPVVTTESKMRLAKYEPNSEKMGEVIQTLCDCFKEDPQYEAISDFIGKMSPLDIMRLQAYLFGGDLALKKFENTYNQTKTEG